MINFSTLLAALGCGLIAGLFFAFSTAVMTALGRLPPAQGIAAMQSINVVILNPVFLTVFFGTAVICLFLAITALPRWHDPSARYLIAGSVLYLVGSILVTMLFNVPRNNLLASLQPQSAQAAAVWSDYLRSWTAWNHVRTVASLAAAAAFTLARASVP